MSGLEMSSLLHVRQPPFRPSNATLHRFPRKTSEMMAQREWNEQRSVAAGYESWWSTEESEGEVDVGVVRMADGEGSRRGLKRQ